MANNKTQKMNTIQIDFVFSMFGSCLALLVLSLLAWNGRYDWILPVQFFVYLSCCIALVRKHHKHWTECIAGKTWSDWILICQTLVYITWEYSIATTLVKVRPLHKGGRLGWSRSQENSIHFSQFQFFLNCRVQCLSRMFKSSCSKGQITCFNP